MTQLLETVESFVEQLFAQDLDPRFLYHNLAHTRRVVECTKELLEHSPSAEGGRLVLLLAAWLHDTGYTRGSAAHEEKSCEIARDFLEAQKCPKETIEGVCRLIRATERYHQPTGPQEEIIRDADAAHLGSDLFPVMAGQLREELSLLGTARYSDDAWRDTIIEVLQNEHRFYTEYAREHWGPVKEKNLQHLLGKRTGK